MITSSVACSERCWHYRADVGANAVNTHALCGRCISQLFGTGEGEEARRQWRELWRNPHSKARPPAIVRWRLAERQPDQAFLFDQLTRKSR